MGAIQGNASTSAMEIGHLGGGRTDDFSNDPTLIGHVAVWPRHNGIPRGEVIIAVVPSAWRQGIATEACTAAMTRWLQQFPGSTIYAAVHPENVACHALMRKLGLEHEVDGSQFPGIHDGTTRVFWRPGELES